MRQRKQVTDPERPWPYASLLLFGFFGASTREGKRLAWRSALVAGLMLVGMLVVLNDVGGPILRLAAAGFLPVGVVVLGWAHLRYLQALDELSQIIQLKAFAVAYGAAMALYFVSLGHGLLEPGEIFPGGGGLGFWIILAEPVRGAALVFVARAYT